MININNEEAKSNISHSKKLSVGDQSEIDPENNRSSSVPPAIKINIHPDINSEVESSEVNILS